MTIRNRVFLLKISAKKAFRERQRDLIFLAVLVLATTLSFALGKISERNTHHAPIIIQTCPKGSI